ncbi:uncharacterized protein LOC134790822, partial [Cydia splendana]|uniref:uncharacterized protein LOC134790822 n=1 Tax=Cydia splendana TaxID=1100963 RepID=UPI00300D402F
NSVDTSQSTSSNTDEASKEVATATLINLESPVSTSENTAPGEDQLDSIEANDQWHTARMQVSTTSALTDMECSVGRVAGGAEPLELAVGLGSVVARGGPGPAEELAEEAAP